MAVAKRIRNEESYQKLLVYLNEVGLFDDLRAVCLKYYVSLRDIYLDSRGPTVHAARLEVWFVLAHTFKKSNGEIAKIFDRDGSSLTHAFRRLKEKAAEIGKELPRDVTEVAKAVAAESNEAMSAAGMKQAKRLNGGGT